ncbi:hypothetical protein DFH06DRAFT_1338513 [Mycena polygramma]|nr:hypothetical protein DFH06DRAFT_1338513 [Mycena polygramma]
MAQFCRGKTNPDIEQCDCELYDEPKDKNAPSKCRECGHGKSKHPDQEAPPAEGRRTDAKKTVLDIFSAQTTQAEKQAKARLPAKDRAADLDTVRADALRGYRTGAEPSGSKGSSKSRKGKAKAAEAKPKESTVRIVVLTSGIKNDKLRGSQKALRSADIAERENYQCVARDSVIKHDWSNNELTEYFHEVLALPMAYAEENGPTKVPLWAVVAKNYQQSRVVRTAKPTATQVLENKVTSPKEAPIIYIGGTHLRRSDEGLRYLVHRSDPRPAASSDVEEAHLALNSAAEQNSDAEEAGEAVSDYDITKDPDADELSDLPASIIPGRYRMRPESKLIPSVRKRESLDSDGEGQSDKKQKLASGLAHRTSQKTSVQVPQGRSTTPLFLRGESDEDMPMPLTQPGGCLLTGLSRAGPSNIGVSSNSDRGRTSSNSDPHISSGEPSAATQIPCCRKVSPPPIVVIPGKEYAWDGKYKRSPHVNPWNPAYVPPPC